MDRKAYETYLGSPEWQKRRLAALQRADFRCQTCNVPKAEAELHAHHRTYVRLGDEDSKDLTILCRRCHGLIHRAVGLWNEKVPFGEPEMLDSEVLMVIATMLKESEIARRYEQVDEKQKVLGTFSHGDQMADMACNQPEQFNRKTQNLLP